MLGVSRSTLYRSLQRGSSPVPVIVLNGRARIARRALERLLEGTAEPLVPAPAPHGPPGPAYGPPEPPSGPPGPSRRRPMCSAARRSSVRTPSV